MKKEDKCCGECCWFCHEDTDGWGQCMQMDVCDSMHCSDLCTTDEYVSRKEMRHHMAIMLKYLRNKKQGLYNDEAKWPDFLDKPIAFAYKYMTIFGKL